MRVLGLRNLIMSAVTLFGLMVPFLAATGVVYADDAVQFVPSSTSVNNVGGCDGTAANSPICTDIKSDKNPLFGPDGILTQAAGIFGLVTGIISVFMIVIAGLRYINSGGDPQKTSSAKNTIIYAAVGLIVAAIAGTLVRFILSRVNQA